MKKSTHHLPVKVILCVVVEKTTHSRVKGAMSLAGISDIKKEVVNGNVASIATRLIRLILGNGLQNDLER